MSLFVAVVMIVAGAAVVLWFAGQPGPLAAGPATPLQRMDARMNRVVTPRWMRPREGTVTVANHRTVCPSADPPAGASRPHTIEAGEQIVWCASAWRCKPCARRIIERDR